MKDLTWMLGALRVEPGGSMEIIIKKKIKKLKDRAIRSKLELKGKGQRKVTKFEHKKREKAFGSRDFRVSWFSLLNIHTVEW